MNSMAKRLLAWLMVLGVVGTAVGVGSALAGSEKTVSKQCPITKRCPCGK